MSNFYTYGQRKIASCDGLKIVKAIEVSKNLENARALYLRPKLVHSGPMVHFRTQNPTPQAWSWVSLDDDEEKNQLLDQASVYVQHKTGSIDISLRLLIATAAFPATWDKVNEVISTVPLVIQGQIYQYEDGSPVKNTIGGITTNRRFAAHVACSYPYSPALSNIYIGWAPRDGIAYNKYVQRFGSFSVSPRQRPAQLYENDFLYVQRMTLNIPYDSSTFDIDKPIIVEVICGYWSDPLGIKYHEDIQSNANSALFRTREYVRVFCVGSAIYDRGVL